MSIPNLDLSLIPEERRKRVFELVDKAIKRFPMAENTLGAVDGRHHNRSPSTVNHG